MVSIDPRDSKNNKGPIFDENSIPYDYIIIIDSGSKGSRAYVYNWLNAQYLVDNNISLDKSNPTLVKRIESAGGGVFGRHNDDDDGDDSSDDESGDEDSDSSGNRKHGKSKGKNGKVPESVSIKGVLPSISTRPQWNKKIKPGISSFKSNPGKVGKEHVKKLLKAASKFIPKEHQYRTPIFLHATAGMRLLKPSEQVQILDNTCKYIQSNSNFYLPDCASHINIIDGDVEGLYGWIGLNYLMGSFDNPEDHQHGKNHHTYGLLDMGGASTQLAFQPNETEVSEHSNTLYKVDLASFGQHKADLGYHVFSNSFLGYGMYQSRVKYLDLLATSEVSRGTSASKLTLKDPCLPQGYSKAEEIDGVNDNYKFTVEGTGNFTGCLNALYPLLVSSESTKSTCESNHPQDVSSCLLSDTLPSLDFDIDRFIGVSGYWDSIGNLLNLKENHNVADLDEKYANAYKYESFYNKTADVCDLSWKDLNKLNDEINTYNNGNGKNQQANESYKLADLSDEELSELCFKSSWILNVLHRGLGFPRYGVDDGVQQNNGKDAKSSMHVAEKINGSDFSWTLGRAVLYSSAESARAFATKTDTKPDRVGFVHGVATDTFYYGGEAEGVQPRPRFVSADNYKHFKVNKSDDSHWDKFEKHRLAGSLVFLGLLFVIAYLLMGKKKRSAFYQSVKLAVSSKFSKSGKYTRLGESSGSVEFDRDIELGDVSPELGNTSKQDNGESEADDRFRIEDE